MLTGVLGFAGVTLDAVGFTDVKEDDPPVLGGTTMTGEAHER